MMFTFGDYDQSLNKLGQVLILLKFGNSKATDDATRLRNIASPIFATECSGLCYFREVNFLPSNFGDLHLHRSAFGFLMYSKCSSGEDLKTMVAEFDRAKMLYGEPPCLSRHVVNVSEANCDFATLLDCRFTEETVFITKDFEKALSFALKAFIADISSVTKGLLDERKAVSMEDANLIDRTLRVFQLDDKTDSKKQRKLLSGKWCKHIGDLLFACGQLTEAEQYFTKAIELLKSCNDPWLAAAKESLVAVSLLNMLKTRQLPDFLSPKSSPVPAKQWTIWLAWFEDATNVYSNFRPCHSLYLESLLRLAHLQTLANQKCNASRTLGIFSSFEIVSTPGIGRNYMESDRATRFLKAAKIFESFGWHRKAAFHYRMAAMQSVTDVSQSSEWVTCHHLLMKAVRGYGLATFSNAESQPALTPGFIQLQSRLLMDLYTSAQAFGNYPLALRHACQALDIGGQTLFSYQLSQIFNDMRKLASHSNTINSPLVIDPDQVLLPLGSSPYPRLLGVSFHPETLFRSSSIIRPSNSNNSLTRSPQKNNFFIYSPFSHPEKPVLAQPVCVCLGEEIKLVLEVENPFAMPLKIDSLSILTSQKSQSIDCISVNDEILYPGAPKNIVLTCRSPAVGSFFLVGCSATVCGIPRKILFADVLSNSSKFSQQQSCYEVEVLPIKLPMLFVKPNCDGEIGITAFLGEKAETHLEMENYVTGVKPSIVDLTLKGVPSSVEKALNVSFHSDSLLKVSIDGTQLPCRFSSSFDVSAKFIYTTMITGSEEPSSQQFFRSLTFTFRTFISPAVHATVVGVARKTYEELVLDVKLEHLADNIHSNNPVEILLCDTVRSDELERKFVLNPGAKRHLHCFVDNQRLASLFPGLCSAETMPVADSVDLSRLLKFNWKLLSEDLRTILRSGQCSAVVCGSELISQLRVPPFHTSVLWWKTEQSQLTAAKYDYGNPVNCKLADPVTFSITICATAKSLNASIRLNLESGNQQQNESAHMCSLPPYFISGLRSTAAIGLVKGETLDHTFCVIPSATGRHRMACDVVTSCGVWPLCPTIYLSCVE